MKESLQIVLLILLAVQLLNIIFKGMYSINPDTDRNYDQLRIVVWALYFIIYVLYKTL